MSINVQYSVFSINPCKREIVCLAYSYSAGDTSPLTSADMFSCVALTG